MQSAENRFVTAKDIYNELVRKEKERTLGHIRLLSVICSSCLALITLTLGTLVAGWSVGVVHTAPINTTGWEYNAALAKWNNLHVDEYEQTFSDGPCRFKMTVTIDRSAIFAVETMKHIESLGPTLGSPGSSDGCAPKRFNQQRTVGNLFYRVDGVLTNPNAAARNPFHGYREYYEVEFDQARGYPRYFLTASDYYTHEITIENLTVLSQSNNR